MNILAALTGIFRPSSIRQQLHDTARENAEASCRLIKALGRAEKTGLAVSVEDISNALRTGRRDGKAGS